MKKSELRQIIREEVRAIQEGADLDMKHVRKAAKDLGLKIRTSSVSWGYAGTIADTKTKLSTDSSAFNSSPETKDFLARLKKLRAYIGGKDVMFKGTKVTGLK